MDRNLKLQHLRMIALLLETVISMEEHDVAIAPMRPVPSNDPLKSRSLTAPYAMLGDLQPKVNPLKGRRLTAKHRANIGKSVREAVKRRNRARGKEA